MPFKKVKIEFNSFGLGKLIWSSPDENQLLLRELKFRIDEVDQTRPLIYLIGT